MESIASAINLSFNMVLRRKVLILFNVEKLCLLSNVVMGVVIIILTNFVTSQNVSVKLRLINDCNDSVMPLKDSKSSRQYNSFNSLISF